MGRKTTDAAENAVAETDTTQQVVETSGAVERKRELLEKQEQNKSGFYIYIGPNIKHLIQTGTIYPGKREDALARAARAIKEQPLVKTLIVSGDALPSASVKVRTPGNVMYANYWKLAGKE